MFSARNARTGAERRTKTASADGRSANPGSGWRVAITGTVAHRDYEIRVRDTWCFRSE